MILLPDEDLSTLEEKVTFIFLLDCKGGNMYYCKDVQVTSTGGPDQILRPNELMGRARHRFTHLTLPRLVIRVCQFHGLLPPLCRPQLLSQLPDQPGAALHPAGGD